MSSDEQRGDASALPNAAARAEQPLSVLDPDIYHTVMESLPDGIILVDESQRIVGANLAIESLFGYSREDLI